MAGREAAKTMFPLLLLLFLICTQIDAASNTCANNTVAATLLQPTVQVLSAHNPRIYYYPAFLSGEEADWLRKLAQPHLSPSEIGMGDDDELHKETVRKSEAAFLNPHLMMGASAKEASVVEAVRRRTERETKLPMSHFEDLQVQHYPGTFEGGGLYRPHYDAMGEPYGGPHAGQRIATMIYFLQDVPDGGATIFPMVSNTTARFGRETTTAHQVMQESEDQADGKGNSGGALWEARFRESCAHPADSPWLTVTPKKGAAIPFYTTLPDGRHDPFSLHGGCPTKQSSKWISQQWIRDRPYLMTHSMWALCHFMLTVVDVRSDAASSKRYDTMTDLKRGLVLRELSGEPSKVTEWRVEPSDDYELCSETSQAKALNFPGPGLQQSGSATFALWLEAQQCGGPPSLRQSSVISLRAQNATGFVLSVVGCDITAFSPGQDKPVTLGSVGQGQRVFLAWTSEPMYGPYGPIMVGQTMPPTTRYRHRLFIDGEPAGDWVQSEEVPTASMAWDEARLCVEKGKGMMLGDLSIYSTALSAREVSELFHNTMNTMQNSGSPAGATQGEGGVGYRPL